MAACIQSGDLIVFGGEALRYIRYLCIIGYVLTLFFSIPKVFQMEAVIQKLLLKMTCMFCLCVSCQMQVSIPFNINVSKYSHCLN